MKISFVIPTHNCAAWLHPAVESCLNQTHKDIEVVIVDDASTDSTKKYLSFLDAKKDKRIKIVSLNKNVGRSEARNIGNREASGEVICVLDADDISYPKRAELTAKAFENGVSFVYGSAVMMSSQGEKMGEEIADVFNKDRAIETMKNRIVHSTVAYTKELALKFPYRGGEIADLGIDDWAQQVQLWTSGLKLDFIPNVLSAYRVLETSITAKRVCSEVKEAKKRFMESLKVPA